MRKILFLCFIALGISANAQYFAKDGFENNSGDIPGANHPGIELWGPASTTFSFNTSNKCAGTAALQANLGNTNGAYAGVSWSSIVAGQDSNGNKIDYSIQIRKSGNATGTFFVNYSLDGGATFTQLSSTPYATGTIACATISGTIPAGEIPAGSDFLLFFEYDRATGTNTVQFDELSIKQENLIPPGCTSVISPADGDIDINPFKPLIKWGIGAGAESYKLYVGSTPGASDVLNGTSISNTQYQLASTLSANTIYYARVTAVNANGETVTCQETSFTTGVNKAAPYCSSTPVAVANAIEPITSVIFAGTGSGINNTTNPAVNGSDAHEFFIEQKATVLQGSAYPISLMGNTNGNYTTYFTVFVDWDQNGTFDKADEKYFQTGASRISVVNSTGVDAKVATGNITVPSGALTGDTRMRIIKQYNAAATDACAATPITYGQAEDYTITVTETLAVSDINKNNVSLYPNPFHDILKISDVKGVKSVSVNDASGREVKSLAPSAELNLSSLKSGLYIVNLKMEDGSTKSFKAIKK